MFLERSLNDPIPHPPTSSIFYCYPHPHPPPLPPQKVLIIHYGAWHVLPIEWSERTAIIEFVGKQATWLKDKLPCLDRSASSGVNERVQIWKKTTFKRLCTKNTSLLYITMHDNVLWEFLIIKFEKTSDKHRKDDYAKDGGPGAIWSWCSFYHDPVRH